MLETLFRLLVVRGVEGRWLALLLSGQRGSDSCKD